jgi:hypothetical protein
MDNDEYEAEAGEILRNNKYLKRKLCIAAFDIAKL